jgi:hopanoid biosynthesis associated RND transporter like protein HpnN
LTTADPGGRGTPNLYMRCLARWVRGIARHPVWTLALAGLLTAVALVYSLETLRLNSDDSKLISQDEPFRKDYKAYIDLFPQLDEITLIVLTSPSIDLAKDATERLAAALEQRDDLVETLYAPGADPFFEDHGLLYLDPEDLDEVVERLAEAQPALTALSEDPSLRGLFHELEQSLDALADGEEIPSGFARIAERVSEVAEALLVGRARPIAWADEILANDEEVYRVLIVQGRTYFDDSSANARLLDGIRSTARELGITPENGVRVRLTGMIPLAHEELQSVQGGLEVAAFLSLVLLAAILGFGVRSLRLMVAMMITLLVSLVLSTAWAMLSIGELNVISAAFSVLLIGLGVDFAIHIGLRFEEEVRHGQPVFEAACRAGEDVGGPVSLCALTSAIGFLSFVPTPYHALAALGVIAGGGMFVTLAVSFTVFPALLVLMGPPSPKPPRQTTARRRLYPLLMRHAGALAAGTALLSVGALLVSSHMTFDFSTLGMKDPESEGMTTLRELQAENMITDYSATVLATDLSASEEIAARLAALPEVAEVRPPSYYVPDEQERKLAAIDGAAFFLESVLYPAPPREPPSESERLDSLRSLRERVASLPPGDESDPTRIAARRLAAALDGLAARSDPAAASAELESLVISDLTERIEWLRRALAVSEIGFADLPASLRERLVAPDGHTQVLVLPREDLSDTRALSRFVDAVKTVDPRATGRPAVEAGIGAIVVKTFRLAIGLAFVAIFGLMVVVLGNPFDALLVLAPIGLAAILTTAVAVLIDMPFNMSNVVVIPLVLGLGVDNGIHVFMRIREDHSLADALGSSTPRAVLLSALTTLAAFASLSVSHHPGIRSLGVLLSISVLFLLVCALVVLPALALVSRRTGDDQSRSAETASEQ